MAFVMREAKAEARKAERSFLKPVPPSPPPLPPSRIVGCASFTGCIGSAPSASRRRIISTDPFSEAINRGVSCRRWAGTGSVGVASWRTPRASRSAFCDRYASTDWYASTAARASRSCSAVRAVVPGVRTTSARPSQHSWRGVLPRTLYKSTDAPPASSAAVAEADP